MKVGDEVILKSKEECEKNDRRRIGIVKEMYPFFGKKVRIKSINKRAFTIEEGQSYHYSKDWIEKFVGTITFKLDDDYSEPTQMYLKATSLAIDVMERIRVENPRFWELLINTNSRDNFFREILATDVRYWEVESFNFKTAGFASFFNWNKSLFKTEYWNDLYGQEVKAILLESYHFIDTNINFSQLCFDTLDDGKVSFLVEGNDMIYVGWLKKWIGRIPQAKFQREIEGHPFEIRKIQLQDKLEWIKFLREYTIQYNKKKREVDSFIKDRSRTKIKNKFVVTSF